MLPGSGPQAAPRRLCVAIDDSVHSQFALDWLQRHVLRSGDEVHVVVVALPVPYPVRRASPPPASGAAAAPAPAAPWRGVAGSSTSGRAPKTNLSIRR